MKRARVRRLGEVNDVELWEGACAIAEESAALSHTSKESVADWCKRVLANNSAGLSKTIEESK